MLHNINWDCPVKKEEWKAYIKENEKTLGLLQQKIKALNIPVTILFEGWSGVGKGKIIGELLAVLDPRGVRVHRTEAANEEERKYPWLKRFWQYQPAQGNIAILDHSWYRDISLAQLEDMLTNDEIDHRQQQINYMEKSLVEDGNVIIKVFLQTAPKVQADKLDKLEANPATRWRVKAKDRYQNHNYDAYLKIFSHMMRNTNTKYAPWYIIDGDSTHSANMMLFQTITHQLEDAIAEKEKEILAKEAAKTAKAEDKTIAKAYPIVVDSEIKPLKYTKLKNVDLSKKLEKEEYDRQLKHYQKRLFELHNILYAKKIPVVIAIEGWDASGKGGAIKRFTQALDPRGYHVVPIASPSALELSHNHLWRFWLEVPKAGHMVVFDRTWYGRVLVEQIEGFCTKDQYARAYDEINHFEKDLHDAGAIIVKFWSHVDADEQLFRFEERARIPEKQWKITDEDWRNREKWDAYEDAANKMFKYTNTSFAPWTILAGNDKKYARVQAIKTLVEAIEARLKNEI